MHFTIVSTTRENKIPSQQTKILFSISSSYIKFPRHWIDDTMRIAQAISVARINLIKQRCYYQSIPRLHRHH